MTDNRSPLGPLGSAFLASQDHREALSDLSAQEINALSFGEYARLTGRATPTMAALDAVVNHAEPAAEGRSSAPTGDHLPSNSSAPRSRLCVCGHHR